MTQASWISDDGARHRSDPEPMLTAWSPLAAALHQRRSVEFERGWIAETVCRNRMTVRLDLDSVSGDALAVAIETLDSWDGPVTLIRRVAGAWLGELAPSGAVAAERLTPGHNISDICFSRPLISRRLTWDVVLSQQSSPILKRAYQAWENGGGEFSTSAFGDPELISAMQVYSIGDPGQGSLNYLYIGQESTTAAIYGRTWAANAEHQPSIPDHEFSAKVRVKLFAIACGSAPEADVLQAKLRRADGDYLWLAYERIALPMRLLNGRPILTCLTAFVPFGAGLIADAEQVQPDPTNPSRQTTDLH